MSLDSNISPTMYETLGKNIVGVHMCDIKNEMCPFAKLARPTRE